MSNKVNIHILKEGHTESYVVQAISMKKGEEVLKIPSPFGSETMTFNSLPEAIDAIKNVGYDYSVCKSSMSSSQTNLCNQNIDYDKIADVFIKNLGNENLEIRTSSINALAKFGVSISDKLNSILSENRSWLVQQSVIKCIEKIISSDSSTTPIFLDSLIQASETENTLLKSAALKALERICELKPE